MTEIEIRQQPDVWREVAAGVRGKLPDLGKFLAPILADPNSRIIFTGAGTSAFAGQIAAPALSTALGRRFEAVPSTTLVAYPSAYFTHDLTLLVSFARSGDSPESVAATRIADALGKHVQHLIITCSPTGALAREHQDRTDSLVVAMPDLTNDRGFAMTSSFTSMLLGALLILHPDAAALETSLAAAERLLAEWDTLARLVLDRDVDRIVYLGSGPLEGLAREAALKMLELSAGRVVSYFDSSLGFRHGPKAVITARTVAVIFVSNDPYSQKYDLDIAEELTHALGEERVLLVLPNGTTRAGSPIRTDCVNSITDGYLALPYVIVAQIFALTISQQAGLDPDNPFPDGSVNRIVEGVRIHPLPVSSR